MERSSSLEFNSHSFGQEIPRFICNPIVHHRVRNNPSMILL